MPTHLPSTIVGYYLSYNTSILALRSANMDPSSTNYAPNLDEIAEVFFVDFAPLLWLRVREVL